MKPSEISEQVDSVIEAITIASNNASAPILTQQERVDLFLDSILSFKEKLSKTCEEIESLNPSLEELTWVQQPLSEELLPHVRRLIDSCYDLHKKYVKTYVGFKNLRQRGIAKQEIKQFKAAIDDFKDITTDLESVFFIFPNNKEFQKVTEGLKAL